MNLDSLKDIINPHFVHTLQRGIDNNPKPDGAKFITVEVSSCHMSVFYEYYNTLQEIGKAKGYELYEGQCYSHIVLVWDIETEDLLYFDAVGVTSEAHYAWDKFKDSDDWKPKPYVAPLPAGKDHRCEYDTDGGFCKKCGKTVVDLLMDNPPNHWKQ